MDEISKTIQDVIKNLFDIDQAVLLSRPNEKFGDLATNVAMQLAPSVHKAPHEIAEKIAEELRKKDIFTEITVAGPGFLNIRIKPAALANILSGAWSSKYGQNEDGSGKTVIVEYPSQNMAKPYSVGHLRPGNQGWAVKRLMEDTGWHVITDNHLGDYGAPFGIWVTGFLKFSSPEKLEKDGVYELGRVYIQMRQALKDEAKNGDHVLADEVQNWLLKLENGDEQAKKYSQKFIGISMKHIHDIMQRLKISTDYEYGETFYVGRGKKLVEKLIHDGIAVKNDDGSVIVPIDEYGIDVPVLIQKSNGTALYATTDLATMVFREETWHPDRVIYAVGAEQKFYFEQLFAMAKKIGIQSELVHLWFGVIDQLNEDGTREKMSSRKGVILMEELLDRAEAEARKLVDGRNVSDDDIKKIALGAIKFNDFIADRRTNILFDWDSIFALSGMSGPYIQYAAVRINKILRDNKDFEQVEGEYDFAEEKKVILKLLEYPGVIKVAARDLEPHKVAMYLYELAREMNRYYEKTPVATGNVSLLQKTARIGLLKKVEFVFEHGLDLLGIEIPETM